LTGTVNTLTGAICVAARGCSAMAESRQNVNDGRSSQRAKDTSGIVVVVVDGISPALLMLKLLFDLWAVTMAMIYISCRIITAAS
jgi:hypothetical protein